MAVVVSPTVEVYEDLLESRQTQILDDIVNSRSDDIDKVEVSEAVSEFFVRQRPFSARLYSARSRTDPWKCMNPAVRQMYTASVKGPRCRYFPGYRGPGFPLEPFSMSRPATARQERLHKLKELKEKEMELLKEAEQQKANDDEDVILKEAATAKRFTRIEKKLNQKATEMMSAEPEAVDTMEKELTEMAETLVAQVLTNTVYRLKLHNLAHIMVMHAMENAALELGFTTPRGDE